MSNQAPKISVKINKLCTLNYGNVCNVHPKLYIFAITLKIII